MNAQRWVLGTAALIATSALAAEAPERIALPAPRAAGPASVEQALRQRRSLRSLAEAPLTRAEVGQLCWAAQGVTDDQGHRTAPSAHGAYLIELYVLAGSVEGLRPGLYHYVPARHALELVAEGDRRHELEVRAVGQTWIARAPALFVVAGARPRAAALGERGVPFMYVEAGLAAQAFFLEAVALGMGSTFVGGLQPAAAREVLGLPPGEEVIGLLPVGRRGPERAP